MSASTPGCVHHPSRARTDCVGCGRLLGPGWWRRKEPAASATTTRHFTSVQLVGGEWVARCYHEDDIWEIHRGTEHNAKRSLNAHLRWEHAESSDRFK